MALIPINKAAMASKSLEVFIMETSLAVHGAAAVDYLTADVRRKIAGEEESYIRYIFRCASAA
jgi:hypothetical protein